MAAAANGGNGSSTKYKSLYQTFKKSLGISADITSEVEFDSAFNNLVAQINKRSDVGGVTPKKNGAPPQLPKA